MAKPLTALGRELRKLRVDLQLTMKQMASAVELSPSMLSTIEHGEKPASPDLVKNLVKAYPEVAAREQEFRALAALTTKTVRIDVEANRTPGAASVALLFAHRFATMSVEQLNQLQQLLGSPPAVQPVSPT